MTVANRLTVSTNCPNCGAAIDFGEGTNALRCDHCRSELLVTGHGRVLSYFVSPRVDRQGAIATARFAEPENRGPIRTGDARLHFLPYYRVTATDLRWQAREPERRLPADTPEYEPDADARLTALIARLAERDLAEEIECDDRAIERNFLALELPQPSLYSLGMRPNALRLELSRRDAIEPLGHVVAPEIPVERAVEIGQKTGSSLDVACRAVIGTVLSLVYFPFWLVEILRPRQKSLTIVDAVSRSIVERGVGPDFVERLARPATGEPTVIGFRPLVCPNCGWGLPVTPDHVIFYCGSCARAWRIAGDELLELPYRVATTAACPADGAEHLPFWTVEAAVGDDPPRPFVVPAFRYRRARHLVEVTSALSGEAPELVATGVPLRSARGGSYDETDAAGLVRLARAGSGNRTRESVERSCARTVLVEKSELVWMPLAADAYELHDPARRFTLVRNLLV